MHSSKIRYLTIGGAVGLCVLFSGCGDYGAADLFQAELNSARFNLVYPATDRLRAGALLVEDVKGARFVELSALVSPTTDPILAEWSSEQLGHKFTLRTAISGLTEVLGGQAAIKDSPFLRSNITIDDISISGRRLRNSEEVLHDSAVAEQVRRWLSGGRRGYRVYIVNTVLTTTNFSLTVPVLPSSIAFAGIPPPCAAATPLAIPPGIGGDLSPPVNEQGNVTICGTGEALHLSMTRPLAFAVLLTPIIASGSDLHADIRSSVTPIKVTIDRSLEPFSPPDNIGPPSGGSFAPLIGGGRLLALRMSRCPPDCDLR